jgi:hypothetical protein
VRRPVPLMLLSAAVVVVAEELVENLGPFSFRMLFYCLTKNQIGERWQLPSSLSLDRKVYFSSEKSLLEHPKQRATGKRKPTGSSFFFKIDKRDL